MALTVSQLASALRLTDGTAPEEPLLSELNRLLAVGNAFVDKIASGAPDDVKAEAVIRFAGYLWDMPPSSRGSSYDNAWANSGAGALVSRWVVRRLAVSPSDDPAPTPDVPTTGGLDAAQVQALIDAAIAGLPGPYVLPAAAPGVRGGVQAVTNTIIDANTSTGIFGWALSHVRRVATAVVESVVPAWARQPSPPSGGGGTTLPAFNQADEQGLKSRAGALYWEPINEVPDTPGESSAIGHSLQVHGEGDQDYRWGATVDAAARASAQANAGSITDVQGVAAATRLALAGLEDALPDPPVPAAEATAKNYQLHLPATSERDTRASWQEATAQSGAEDTTARAAASRNAAAITAEEAARAAADTALGVRIDGLAGYAAPVFDPDYWVKSGDARSVLVHLDPRAAAITGLAKVRLNVQGISKTISSTAEQDVYSFALTAADAANITRAAGNSGSDTIHSDVTLLDSSDAELQRWRGLLRVLDAAPAGGGGGFSPTRIVNSSIDIPRNGVWAATGGIVPATATMILVSSGIAATSRSGVDVVMAEEWRALTAATAGTASQSAQRITLFGPSYRDLDSGEPVIGRTSRNEVLFSDREGSGALNDPMPLKIWWV